MKPCGTIVTIHCHVRAVLSSVGSLEGQSLSQSVATFTQISSSEDLKKIYKILPVAPVHPEATQEHQNFERFQLLVVFARKRGLLRRVQVVPLLPRLQVPLDVRGELRKGFRKLLAQFDNVLPSLRGDPSSRTLSHQFPHYDLT